MTIMLGAGLQSSRIRDPTGLHKLTIELKHLVLVPPVRRLRGGYEDFFPPYLPGSHFPIPAVVHHSTGCPAPGQEELESFVSP
jgi:hypothetical protein